MTSASTSPRNPTAFHADPAAKPDASVTEASKDALTAYQHILAADAILHDTPGDHAAWAHACVHQAAAHLSDNEDMRQQAAEEARSVNSYAFRDATGKLVFETEAAPSPAVGGWQPIETAPKDGTEVDLWIAPLSPDGRPLTPCRVPNAHFHCNEWLISGGDPEIGHLKVEHRITHWRSLPTPPPSSPAEPAPPVTSDLVAVVGRLRADGWAVAVHNDYKLYGEKRTFWLFTHLDGRWIKGEGKTDAEALEIALRSSSKGGA